MTEIAQVEDRLYATLVPGARQIKVSMLLVKAFPHLDFPADEIVNSALATLAERHDVEIFGDVNEWRHSEILRFGSLKS
ncbi:hypothetical protein [Candidatus Rhodobacter oscarellae]|uniref:hypothetical protein n=1 Tax=Candidatus Rhodobacter oscarellae TaxID=1675527 RepID=UPI00128F1C42|nr:hypothetical protein [Candidatus Rhodobacter lobularis]